MKFGNRNINYALCDSFTLISLQKKQLCEPPTLLRIRSIAMLVLDIN